MSAALNWVRLLRLETPLALLISLTSLALSWFVINTITVSLAISFWMNQSFWSVWREGLSLSFLNFVGSAAATGLIISLYVHLGSSELSLLLLALPIAAVLYQLYWFYVTKYDQAQRHITDLNNLYLQTIETMATAVDAKDRYTHGHIRRVEVYGSELARCMGITDEKQLMAMRAGALLHDIGKIAIPEYILNKPASLTESEYDKMKLHPVVGANMLKNIEFPYPIMPLVRSHHERWDGNGYPDRLKGEEIPLSARILSLVDCYDALTTNRPYRSPMPRNEIIEFFTRESGKAYDPAVVQTFIDNLERLEKAGREAVIPQEDIWGIRDAMAKETPVLRPLEKVQPTVTYSKALSGDAETQRQFYSIFEFARGGIQCLSQKDVLLFMGTKLSELLTFDAAAFFVADLQAGAVVAEHVIGRDAGLLDRLTLPLEQKLSGWAAANNQALCNLPPFPDFMHYTGEKPSFQLSAIAPMNQNGSVFGAITLYRNEKTKFTEEEFRKLELIASQTALALSKCNATEQSGGLFDALTGLPNGYQLYLMFDQIATDATKFDYPFALLAIRLDDARLRRRWGHIVGDEAIKAAANYLSKEVRETDLLVRYASDEFLAVIPRADRNQAEGLKSRFQDDLDHFRFQVRAGSQVALPVSIGIAMFAEDGTDIEILISAAEFRMREDSELRSAVRRVAHASTAEPRSLAALQGASQHD
jgi:diguanylate cyclase (GGDEF)-like protein/putative nucleotidyltransferase with HDIG domain